MTNKKSTKKALITSALCLLLCVSMLVGTTFAWFTDKVESLNNKIVAGNLDVELEYSKDFVNWNTVGSDTDVFEEELWEPGRTEVVYLRVKNVGTLALKYILNVNIASETGSINVYGDEFELSDHIEYGVVEVSEAYASRSAAQKAIETVAVGLKEAYAPETQTLYPVNNMPEDGSGVSEVVLAMVVYMPASVGNEANYKTGEDAPEINLGISLLATQLEYEEDSFGSDYDVNAKYMIPAGESATLLNPVIGEGVINNGTLNITGGTITNDGFGLQTTGDATLTDVTVDAGSAAEYGVTAIGADAKLTLNGVNLPSAGGAIGAADGAQVTVNNGDYSVDSTSTSGRYLIYAEGAGTVVTVNGGNFDFNKTQNQKRAYACAMDGSTIYITGGTFGKASTRSGYTAGILTYDTGKVIITGGTFGFDPTTWVADGYKVIKNGSTWTVVPENVNEVVSNATQLQAALDAATGDYIIYINADIEGDVTATQKPDVKVTINGNGNTFAGVITVDGKSARYETAGLTIQNVNFNADAISADAYIRLGHVNAARYTNNVTVKGCTFSGNGIVAVKSYTGGDWNVTIDGCTVNAGMHSLAQFANVEKNLTITNCVVNSKNGANLNNTPSLVMSGCTFNVQGYAVRLGVNGGTNNGTFSITDCALTSACAEAGDAVIILRGNMTGATLDLAGTTLAGTPEIIGTANIINN